MNENNGFSNSNNGIELKCSLCKELLLTEKNEEIIQVIDGLYFFILINVLTYTGDWRTFMLKILKIFLEINNLFFILSVIKPFTLP